MSKKVTKIGRQDLTEDLAVAMFREMWSEIARTNCAKRETRIVREYNGHIVISRQYRNLSIKSQMVNDCILCEWVLKKTGKTGNTQRGALLIGDCRAHCPIVWGADSCTCTHTGTAYSLWGGAETELARKQYAAQVAILPRRYNVGVYK